MSRRLQTLDPVRPPYELGLSEARRSALTWVVFALMVIACVSSASLSAVMFGLPGAASRLLESPVADGIWLLEWGGRMQSMSVARQEEVRALRLVVGGAAALLTVMCLLIVAGLWRQRLLLRKSEYFIQWAVGARRLQLTARLFGEGRLWAAGILAATLLATAILFGLLERTFPGDASVDPNLGASAILMTGLSVVLVRWESRAGPGSGEATHHRLWELVASPPIVGAVGFAVLSGVGLLAIHAPYASAATDRGQGTVVSASLTALPVESRGEEILGWTDRASAAGAQVGFASAGAARATGRTDYATVECGRCFEGLIFMPLKVVRAEVHAVAPDTFVHLGVAVTRGRDFDNLIDRNAPDAAIVSQALAARHFERGEPIGRRLKIGNSAWLTVVGVVEDRDDVQGYAGYAIYLPLALVRPTNIEILVDGPASALQTVLEGAPLGVKLDSPRPRREVFAVHHWFRGVLLAVGLATLALLGAGLWVSASNEAHAARQEVAVRRAVGARRRSVWRFYLSFAGGRLAVALIAGAWLSLFLGAGLAEAYASIPQIDWIVWGGAAAWVSAMYVLGSLPPILRAAAEPLVPSLNAG